MLPDDTRNKIKDIATGVVLEGPTDYCTAIRNFLCERFATNRTDKTQFESNVLIKEEQAVLLEQYAQEQDLWLTSVPDQSRYLTRGGEAQIYLDGDQRSVIKINDGVYYATWLEFFNSILLHNLIFPTTSYTFTGFIRIDGALHAILKQPFITSDAQAELSDIRALLQFNGFELDKRHDYLHAELGLRLEDMHDENVLVHSETLFFIDSVFYLVEPAL